MPLDLKKFLKWIFVIILTQDLENFSNSIFFHYAPGLGNFFVIEIFFAMLLDLEFIFEQKFFHYASGLRKDLDFFPFFSLWLTTYNFFVSIFFTMAQDLEFFPQTTMLHLWLRTWNFFPKQQFFTYGSGLRIFFPNNNSSPMAQDFDFFLFLQILCITLVLKLYKFVFVFKFIYCWIEKASISYSKSPSGCEKACPFKYNELPKHLNNLQCAPLSKYLWK